MFLPMIKQKRVETNKAPLSKKWIAVLVSITVAVAGLGVGLSKGGLTQKNMPGKHYMFITGENILEKI